MSNKPIKTSLFVEELLEGKIDAGDLPLVVDLLESIDRLLIEEFKNENSTHSLTKIRTIRKQILARITLAKYDQGKL